jgi:chromosomal replication initiation ATPase DnaA
MQGYDFDKIVDRISKIFELKPDELLSKTRQRKRVKARSVLCYWAVNELKLPGATVARRLKISNSAVSRAFIRGQRIASDMELELFEVK